MKSKYWPGKILIYDHRKTEPRVFDVSTVEKENVAFKTLFDEFESYWQMYNDLDDMTSESICEPCEKDLHKYCADREECICENEIHSKERLRRRSRLIRQRHLLLRARARDYDAMKELMRERSDDGHEYEIFMISTMEGEK